MQGQEMESSREASWAHHPQLPDKHKIQSPHSTASRSFRGKI